MPRTFSPTMTAAMLSQHTEEVITSIVRITHPDIEGYFLTNDNQPVVRTDATYQPWPFTLKLPDDTGKLDQDMQCTIDNIDPEIEDVLKTLTGPRPKIEAEIVLASQPDITEIGPVEATIMGVDGLATSQLELSLSLDEDFGGQEVPCTKYTPHNSPGGWR